MKEMGDFAEAKFLAKILELGHSVSIPFGDNLKYDFIVDVNGLLSKVQIKSTSVMDKARNADTGATRYKVGITHGRGHGGSYKAEDVDFIICYIVPLNLWYIMPNDGEVAKSIQINPNSGRKSKYDKFRERWDLLYGDRE